jgi:hypothetical protein
MGPSFYLAPSGYLGGLGSIQFLNLDLAELIFQRGYHFADLSLVKISFEANRAGC